ncbi:hypothetical protein JW698_00455 [Candidatus Wolfebacteria bacterium]|nr:hypothetical protein [Candidatus Wolfebacteria bacterium]
MTISTLLSKAKTQKIGKEPVVVLPLSIWEELTEYLENIEMVQSQSLKKKISKARSEKKLILHPKLKKY